MTSNVTLPGTGIVIASEEIATTQYQRIKLIDATTASTNGAVINAAGQVAIVGTDTTATGSLTATGQVALVSTGGISTVFVQTNGTWVGTLVTEGTLDTVNWFSVNSVPQSGIFVTSTTTNGAYAVDVSGLAQFRVRCSVFTSGTIVINLRSSGSTCVVALDAALPPGSNTIGALVANQSVNTAQYGGTAIVTGGVAGAVGVGGITAAAATATGNPVRIGAIATTINPAAVTSGQVSNVMTDKVGRVVIVQGHTRELIGKQATTITSSVTATTVVTALASTFRDISFFTATNSSATATLITLTDGTTSFVFNLAAGGFISLPFNPPLPATTIAVGWTVTCTTSVASVYINVVYVNNI